jgi:triosephosphate isomerase
MGGNWKLNPTTVEDAKTLTDGIIQHVQKSDYSDVVIFPPYPLLPAVAEKLKDTRISVGAL